jgi:hypothetical protein
MPSLHLRLGQSIFSSCDRTGARSISSVRGLQRRGQCHDHRVLVLARARTWVRTCATPGPVLALARPSPLPQLGAQRRAHLVGTVARACPLPRARAHDSIGKAAPQEDAPMPRRLARKCLQGRKRRSPCARIGRPGMVAAFGKAVTTAHGPSATIVQNARVRAARRRRQLSVDPGPVGTPRPPFPPPRPSPLDPPTWAPP